MTEMKNGDWLLKQNPYDLLLKMQAEITVYRARCILEVLTGGTQSTTICKRCDKDWETHDISPCKECLQNWLNDRR